MKKKREFFRKTAFWSAVTTAAYFFTVDIVTTGLYYRKDPDIQAYVEKNLEHIIKKQEEKIGITYPAERPRIEYAFPEEYIFPGIFGFYNDKEDTLYLPSGLLTNPKLDFSDYLTIIATFNHTANIKRVLDHELVHFYCDKLKEQVWKKYNLFPKSRLLFSNEEIIADKLINEGIAEYVENTMNGEEEKPFSFEKWPLETAQFSNRGIYRGGYAIVKPIIDKYNKKGIQFLLFNPPTSKEIFTPKEYQERILVDIAKL